MRRHTRFPVRWRAVYGNDEFLAEATVLDLTARGWQVAGSMPVVPGMQLRLQVGVPEKPEPLHVLRAVVLWVHDHEFAIEAQEMASNDHAWVIEFLRQKLGLTWMSPLTEHETTLQGQGRTSDEESRLPYPSVPSIQYVLQRFLAIPTAATDGSLESKWEGDSDSEQSDADALCDHVPETTWNQARRILRDMIAIQEARARIHGDPIADN